MDPESLSIKDLIVEDKSYRKTSQDSEKLGSATATDMGSSSETLDAKSAGLPGDNHDISHRAAAKDQITAQSGGSIEKEAEPQKDPYLVLWNGHGDPGCPKGFEKRNKWIITLIVAAGAFNVSVLVFP